MPTISGFFSSVGASVVAAHQNNPVKATASWALVAAIAVPLVANFEGYAKKPYVDTVGTGHPITWCYGRTKADGPVPPMTMTFTKAKCQDELGEDLQKYDAMVHKCITAPMSPHQEAAFVSFVYNGGQGWLCNPAKHTYNTVAKNFNAGNVDAACNAMLAYDRGDGKVLAGLVTRRKQEAALCRMTT